MTAQKNVLIGVIVFLAMTILPLASGQTWNPGQANTSGGCPVAPVAGLAPGVTALQCTTAPAMAGIDQTNSADYWQSKVSMLNRDRSKHSGTDQTFNLSGSALFPMTWTLSNGGSLVVPIELMGGDIAPFGSTSWVLTGATPSAIATPFAYTYLAMQGPDGLPDLVGETLVEKLDADGNAKTAYSIVDPATIVALGTSFGVPLDIGYENEDTLITFLNPSQFPAIVTVSLWNGNNDQPDFATREATEVYATTQSITVPAASEGPARRPLFVRRPPVEEPTKGKATLDVGSFCSTDVACSGYISNPANYWPTGQGPGTDSLAVIASSSPVQVRVVRVITNPDGTSIPVGAYAFPLIPQSQQ